MSRFTFVPRTAVVKDCAPTINTDLVSGIFVILTVGTGAGVHDKT